MKLFVDTANLTEIQDVLETGTISGITTNPSLLAKEPKGDFLVHIEKIVNICKNFDNIPLSVEVFAKDAKIMYEQALEIYDELEYSNLNIKIPIGYEEIKVVNLLTSRGIDVNCTCCFTSSQLELAALAGARYVSLFYNRLLDVQGDPLKVLQDTNKFIDTNNLNCEIISGSIRKAYDVSDAWNSGSHIVTAGYKIITEMTKHYQTDNSVQGFLSDFKGWME